MERKPRSVKKIALVLTVFMLVVSSSTVFAADKHKQVVINAYTSSFGTSAYTAAFAVGELLAKEHPWLRLSVTETTQASDAVKSVARDAELRKNSLFPIASTTYVDATEGKGAFKGKPVQIEILAMYKADALALVTLDPEIKSMQDLAGKRIALGSKGGAAPPYLAYLKTAGIEPKIIEHISWKPSAEALIDGKIDAALQTLGDVSLDPYIPSSNLQQLQVKKGFHVIPFDKEMIRKTAENILVSPRTLPAGKLMNDAPLTVTLSFNAWGACPEFDPEIAYELAKFLAEHADEFQEIDKKLASIKKMSLGSVPMPPMSINAGAAKYYKEAGIPMGLEE